MPASQAGRRGFESHLPLHVFIYLQGFEACKKPTFRGNEAKASSELVDSLILERLTGSEPRWPSYIKDAGLSLLLKPDTRGCDEFELGGSSSNGTTARDGDLLLDTRAIPAVIRGTKGLLAPHLLKFTSAPQASVANQHCGKHTQSVLAEITSEIADHGWKVRAHDQPEVWSRSAPGWP
jgi:hypothetical protein